MENRSTARAAATAPSPRYEAILSRLKALTAELTGIEEQRVAVDTDFFQAGFDSLLLLQAIQAVEKRMGVRVPLVELLEDITTLGALAEHIDRLLPAEVALNGESRPSRVREEVRVAAAASTEKTAVATPHMIPAPPAFFPPVPPPTDGSASALERLIAQQYRFLAEQSARQFELMAQQLAAVRGEAAPALPAAPRDVPRSPRAVIQPETFVAYQPLNTEAPGGMTPGQKEYLDGFIARYVERTRASKAHQARYHLPLADGRVTARFRRAWKEISYPIAGERAAGSRIRDPDGNEYVDIGMAYGCALFGHAPQFVTRAIQEQLERGYGLGPQSLLAGRAAELVCELGGNERAVFCNSGTEAVMGAIRAARAHTGRSRIAYFAGSYHGWADAVLGRLSTAGDRREVRPGGPGIPALPLGDVLMLEYDEPASLDLLAEHLHDIALVMVEPVQSRRPDLRPFAFLRELRRMTREAGALLLFDELITGFRMAPGGAQAFFGIDADLVTYGKIVAGGLPMGVVAGKREVMSVFDGGVWSYGDDSYPTGQRTVFAGAYFKHPISMAVACAVLEEIRRQGQPMYDRLNERTTRLVERINAFFEAGRYPITAAHFASSFRLFFGREVRFADLFNHHLIHEGVYVIPETGTYFLSTAHTDEDLEKVYQAFRASAEAMRRGGFIPDPSGGDGPRPDVEPAPVPDAAAVSTSRSTAEAPPREGGVRALPLTPGQQQLWIESQMGEDANRSYIESTSIRLRGALDVDALRRALQTLVDRHGTLRITIAPEGDAQLVHPVLAVEVPLEDFRGVPTERRSAEVEAWLRRTVRRPFDLVKGPLVRFALAAVGDDEYVLVFEAHHVALDGWSFGILWKELDVLYAAARDGRSAALPPRADHAAAVQAQIASVREDRAAEEYWLEQFADGVPVLDLPSDRPRPPARSYRGERVTRLIGGGVVGRLAEAGRPHGLTVFHTLLSACFVWLSRLSGEDDLVVGTPAAGQGGRAGTRDLVGYAINVLPIRCRVDASASFVEHARGVRRALLEGLEHQNFSLPRLVDRLLRTRDPGRPPLFAVGMHLDRAREEASLGGLRATFHDNFGGGSKVDLNLGITETADALELRCDYSVDLFDRGTVERWLIFLERLLEQVARDPGILLSDLALIGEEERRRVLEEWNRTEAEVPGACVHRLVEAQAARAPDALAVTSEDGSLTYGELNERANRLAHHLVRLGVGPEARVGICLERGPELIASMLAVLKAGGAYVPLDPAHPAERLGFTQADSAAGVLVTRAALRGAVRLPPGVRVVCLDARREAIAAERADDPGPRATVHGLAYVIYTSGSTGTPKGVAVEHAALANVCAWHARTLGLTSADRSSQLISAGFDGSVLEIWPALTRGARVQVVPDEVRADPPALRDWMVRHGTTVATSPASLTEPLLALPWPAATALRWLVSGADRLRVRPGPGIPFRVTNNYGPTECTAIVTSARVDAGGEGAPRIGRPGDNSRVYVLDAALHPVPVGVPGELYVGGAQVARGYLGRPDLTAERFIPDPFGPVPGARLYRTGDRVRWLADGTLDFLGRGDGQVKVRGYRVEPGEVEAALRRHPAVAACAVVAREEAPGDRRLVAYVVGDAGADELRAHLRRTLPDYMVPAAFVALDQLPLTPNGKLDRAALPAPERASAGEEAPESPLEEVLAGILADVLRLPRLGRHDGFFELGGHSLLATRAVSRIRQALGVELPLRALFESPSVAELAPRVEVLRRAELPQLPPVVPVERTRPLPLSFAQERLWFLHRLQPESPFYNTPVHLRLEGALDHAALERALGEIVRRHQVLRTTLRDDEGDPVQVVSPFTGFALPVVDLSALDPAEREAAAKSRAGEEAARPFDLSAGPLFRAALLRLGAEESVLLLGMHHVVSDGWSMGVLFRELSALYRAFRGGGGSPLPELPVQYVDYAVWQREHLRGDALAAGVAYWKARLAGAPTLLELPTDHPRPSAQTYRGARERLELPDDLAGRLEAVARSEGATLYMVLLAAFQVLLGRYGGSTDVVVGSPIAGRTRFEVEGLIGLFVNTLVLRTDLAGDPRFRDLLRQVRETTLGAYEHQEVPFERLVEELQPERSLSHSPLFQVLFTLESADGPAEGLAGLQVQDMDAEPGTTQFDLSLAMSAGPGGLRAVMTYSTDLWELGTIRGMLGHLGRLLEQVASGADARLSELELTRDAERRLVLEEWNATAAGFPADRCIHHLIEEQAELTPDAVAVRFEDTSLTYRELDRSANRLAHHLIRLGVGPEVRVAVCLDRSLEMVVSLLAVLKAGGAYVPLDPGYPPERLALMLADSAAAVLLTQGAPTGALRVPEGTRVVALDLRREEIAAESSRNPESGVGADNLAYVIYTSGSTGRPKGVMNAHRGVMNRLCWMQAEFGIGAGEVVLQKTPFSFDVSVWELFWPLQRGACLVMARPGGHRDPAYLQEVIERCGVTTLHFVPSMLQAFVEAADPARCASLRRVACSGEALPAALVRRFHERFPPPVSLHNLYGPTEAAVEVTFWTCGRGDPSGVVPIGRPVRNTRLYVLDAALRPVPPGVQGELCIGGVQVARGYLGRPELTAERFVPDPFSGGTGARMYRTGDRARWKEGVIEYLGRLDEQVKICGFRIEPAEVEAVLRDHPSVRDCIVVAREDGSGEKRLAAYVVADAAPDELRTHARSRLPEYMVPSSFMVLPSLPLLPNGKVDRRALPAPEPGGAELEFDEPGSYVEARLIQLWEEILGVEGIGPSQSFFDLGGTSLLALRLFARVNRLLECDLPVATLFAGATVRDMAGAILEQKRAAPSPPASVVPLQPHGSRPPVFFIHSADREVMGYVNLVRYLGPDQPVFGVRDVGEDMSRPVPRIAADHLAAIRAVQPRGPYYLVSWSFGGLVAFDMALQLEREGEPVAFVGLMDTIAPALFEEYSRGRDVDIVVMMAQEVAERSRRPFSIRREDLAGLDAEGQVRRAVEMLREQRAVPPGFDAARLHESCRIVRDRIRSNSGYAPGRFSGTLTLFRATDTTALFDEFFATRTDEERETLGWIPHAGTLEVHPVPGSHVMIGSEPHVRVLAERMRESLAAAWERAGPRSSDA
ncbi:MAG TPA: amino acid adenylation domain-containing protein [Longimicrobiaceae bacterium]|nr:amino acid adenylation domain-containing protein [Longimicrobiaceae bacterium]